MFQRLHLVLLFAVLVVIAFFVVSSLSFSGRLAEGSWSSFFFSFFLILFYRLCGEDMAPSVVASGRLASPPLSRVLYCHSTHMAPQCKQPQISLSSSHGFAKILIQFLLSTLAMSDEVAQDEEDAEDYDLEAIQSRTQAREDDDEDDAATLVAGRRGHHHHNSLSDDQVVFEIGEDEDEDAKKRRLSGENLEGVQGERDGLMAQL